MEQLIEFGLFFAKALVIVVSLLVLIGFIVSQAQRPATILPQLEIERINETLDSYASGLRSQSFSKKRLKEFAKAINKAQKAFKGEKPKIFVIDFDGDIKAHQVKYLRDEVSTVLQVADKSKDEVLLRVNSPGGMVHTYGLAAAQLLRFRQAQIPLTVSIDKVAASGGYMMACTANRIMAAPFAIVGSVGVLAQIPNFHRFLKKHDVDYEEITAGEYKRTVSVLGEITPKGREKFAEQIQDTHNLFKEFVKTQRPQLDLNKIATGEPWFGQRALDLNLIDEIKTSDEYFMEKLKTHDILKVKLSEKKKVGERIAENFALAIEKILKVPLSWS